LNLENLKELGEPLVEAAGWAPTVVVEEEEDFSVEVLASVEKKEKDQVEGTGVEPVPETAELELRDQSERTVEETVRDVEKARTGAEPVLEKVEDRSGEEPDLMEVEEVVRTGDAPVREAEEEPVPASVSMGTGEMPVRDVAECDLFFEDYPKDEFEKVGEYTPEEVSQTPLNPAPEQPTDQTPSSTESRKRRLKL